MDNSICTLTFHIGGDRLPVRARKGETLLESARRAGVFIDAPCSGGGSCGKCGVRLVEGLLDSHQTRHIEGDRHSEGWRLACQSRIAGDASVEIPVTAQWLQSRMRVADLRGERESDFFSAFRRTLAQMGYSGDSGLSVREVCLPVPGAEDAEADLERLLGALGKGCQRAQDGQDGQYAIGAQAGRGGIGEQTVRGGQDGWNGRGTQDGQAGCRAQESLGAQASPNGQDGRGAKAGRSGQDGCGAQGAQGGMGAQGGAYAQGAQAGQSGMGAQEGQDGWNGRGLRMSLAALKKLPAALRAGNFRASCVLRAEDGGVAVLDILDFQVARPVARGRAPAGHSGDLDLADSRSRSGDGASGIPGAPAAAAAQYADGALRGSAEPGAAGARTSCARSVAAKSAAGAEPGGSTAGRAGAAPAAGAQQGAGAAPATGAQQGAGAQAGDLPSAARGGMARGAVAGLAIDVGTTSVSVLLVDLLTGDIISSGSSANRQIRYGADVISRIIESSRPGGMERLHSAIWHETLAPLIRGACGKAGLGPQDIYRVAFAANTTMTHLLLGVSAEHIRLEPYVPAFFGCDGLRGADLPGAWLPGADTLGAGAAEPAAPGLPSAWLAGAELLGTDLPAADTPRASAVEPPGAWLPGADALGTGGAEPAAPGLSGAEFPGAEFPATFAPCAGAVAPTAQVLSGTNMPGTEFPATVAPRASAVEPAAPGLFRADAEILLAPSVGSYVGGDITAGVFASGLFAQNAISLFIDLGTNGEIVVGNSDFMLACACSAGPAFEGGDISCGMRASDGAIESFGIDAKTLEPSYTVVGGARPAGICGSGLIDIVAALFRAGAIDARGRLAREHERIRRDASGAGRFVVAEPWQTETGSEVAVTEIDIDNFVRAKAAIYSAIRTLLRIAGLESGEIESACIAGGIGSGINVESAVSIGMLPMLPEGRYRYVGNTSLMGAYAMAASRGAVARVARIGGEMSYVELSSHPGYMDEFVAACFLPHTDASLFAPSAAVGV
ncbi:MAG: ASKHA domain-containing protein [Clostridiales bacterium]|nr:ASKHA domain-containing protein [Clostridiales bacterium]